MVRDKLQISGKQVWNVSWWGKLEHNVSLIKIWKIEPALSDTRTVDYKRINTMENKKIEL